MEFLVHINVGYPSDGDADEKARLVAAERERARVLVTQGKIKRIWRIPGRWANWGLWEAEDATELHELLSSLPLFAYLDIEVNPLAVHPSDPGHAT